MIFLLKDYDSNEIIEISDWDQVTSRPNFMKDVDLKDQHLQKIIGSYNLKDARTCGIKSCHTGHNKGYIVVTECGMETNIGNCCGKKYFKIKFEDLTKIFSKNLDHEKRKLSLHNAKSKIPEWRQKADILKSGEQNINWAIELIRGIKDQSVVGHFASTELKRMAAVPTNIVTTARHATQRESDIQELFDKRYPVAERTEIDIIGIIEHIDCLLPQNDLRQIFYVSVTRVLKALAKSEPALMSSPKMINLLSKVNNIESNLEYASERLDIARKFLVKENLKPLYNKMKDMDTVSSADLERYLFFINSLQ